MGKPEFEVYEGDDKQHYWRLKSSNGQIIATGGEGYSSRAAALRSIGGVQVAVSMILGEAAGDQAEAAAQAATEAAPA